jgi:hypothetical protein
MVDYYVSGVCKKETNYSSFIDYVDVKENLYDKSSSIWSRENVVNGIENGRVFFTMRLVNGSPSLGEEIHIITVDNVKYLRTDRNSERNDNLGSLPSCCR